MRAFGAPSMKKSCLWSNSRLIGELGSDVVSRLLAFANNAHVLQLHVAMMHDMPLLHVALAIRLKEMRDTAQPLVRRYIDSGGKTRYTGVQKKLKKSQLGPQRLNSIHIQA